MTYREPMTLDERHAIWALYELIDRLPSQTAKGFIRDLEKLSHIGLVDMTTPQRTWLFNLILKQKKRMADDHVELARAFFRRIREGEPVQGFAEAKKREAVRS